MHGSEDDGWRIESPTGFRILRCGAIEHRTPFAHGMSTRHGPEGDAFDLRLPEDGTGVAGTRRRAHLLAAVGLEGARLVEVRQVHGASVVDAREVAPADEADAIVIRDDGLVAGIRVADCVPVLLADRRGRAAAAVHAGWRGVAAGIVPAAIERLARSGVPPADVIAGVGPSIGRCCYQVDRECAAAVAAAAPPDPGGPATVVETPEGPHLDLPAAVRSQLLAAGVAGERVVCAPWCTRCSPALLFSHRGGGPLAGRLLAVIGLGSYGRCP